MIALRALSLIVLVRLLALTPAAAMAQDAAPRSFKHEPMVFFVARGDDDACGPGCNTWIAAEGTFDPGAPQRLRELLAAGGRRKLPIFFHSPGGELQPSIATGNLLREYRMIAGIGQTVPEGCRPAFKADAACRKLMTQGGEVKARLRLRNAVCASGCAYALIGASGRMIGEGARFGIHANRVLPRPEHAADVRRAGPAARVAAENESYALLRHYVTIAGVDPALIDLAIRTPHNRVHWLSREDLTRFGIVNEDRFETGWLRHAKPDGGVMIVKSVTQANPSGRMEFRTTNIGIDCGTGGRTYVTLRRELAAGEGGETPSLKLSSGDAFLVVFNEARRQNGLIEFRIQLVPSDALMRAAASDSLLFREEKASGSREIRLSTKGLADALAAIPARCGGRA